MLPQKCKDLGCRRHMVTANGEDVCAIEKTKKGIGVVPCFSVSEKECRVLRTAYMAAAAASEKGGHDDVDTIPTRE